VRTFRLATAVADTVEVSDRFHLKPLLRAIAFPQHAFVLALSENAVRLVEVFADVPAAHVRVPDLPKSAADAVGRASVNNLTQGTRIANAQGQTVLLHQYARQVDARLRPVLAGRETPLILAATEPLGPIFRAVSNYPALAAEGIATSPDRLSDQELASATRAILDRVYAKEIDAAKRLFQTRLGQRRATTDIGEAARAATNGAVELLLVDIDRVIPGTVSEIGGEVSLAERSVRRATMWLTRLPAARSLRVRGFSACAARIFPARRRWPRSFVIRSEREARVASPRAATNIATGQNFVRNSESGGRSLPTVAGPTGPSLDDSTVPIWTNCPNNQHFDKGIAARSRVFQ
jgi:hypothetical protein